MSEPLPQSIRHAWVDQARGLALFLVVLHHAVSYGADHLPIPAACEAFQQATAPFRMPLLMLLAGLFLDRSLEKGAASFANAKLRQVLWPFLVWTVVSFTLAGEAGRLLTVEVWRGRSYLWFLAFLSAYFLVAWLVRRVPHLLVAALALLVSVLSEDGSKHGERLFVLMAYFFVGAFLGRHLSRTTGSMSWRGVLLLAPFAIAAAAGSVKTGAVKFNPLWFPVVMPALLCVLALLQQLRNLRPLGAVAFMGRHAIVYYLVNTPLYVALLPWLAARGWPVYGSLGFAVAMALAVATALAIARSRGSAVGLLFEFPRPGPRQQAAGLARQDA